MKRALLILAGFYLSTGPALAADDPLAGFYGNTVVVKRAGGETKIHYKDDQTYSSSDTERGKLGHGGRQALYDADRAQTG